MLFKNERLLYELTIIYGQSVIFYIHSVISNHTQFRITTTFVINVIQKGKIYITYTIHIHKGNIYLKERYTYT